jgi:tetratricopeptide (TPR) repeat protein
MPRVAEQPTQPEPTQTPAAAADATRQPTWKSSWQLPALIGSILLLAGGAATAVLTAPKPDLGRMLEQASALVESEKYEEALDGLNTRLRPYLSRRMLSQEQEGLYHLLRGRAVYLGQQRAGIDLGANAETVIGEFKYAKEAGAELTARDTFFVADAWVSVGQYGRALELAETLPEKEREGRARILKRVVERQLKDPQQSGESALKLLADFLKDQELPAADRAWALARQAELLLRRGMAESAISKLVQTMPALVETAGPEGLGELHLLLGRAYLEAGSPADAAKQLERSVNLLLPTDERWARASVLLGRVDEMVRSPEEGRAEARQRYEEVAEKFVGSPARLAALFALAELHGTTPDPQAVDASVAAYAELVKEFAGGREIAEPTRDQVGASLLARATARAAQGDHAGALRFCELAEQLHTRDRVQPDVLATAALSHRAIAEQMLGSGAEGRLVELARLDPATREQARLHMLGAGSCFKRHADRVGIADNDAYGRSLWMAADSFDLAGEPEQAVNLFGDYVKYFPGDARRAEALHRLGQSYQARGDYALAAEQYRVLLTGAEQAGGNIGPYGDLSAVPLAQCMLMDGEGGNDAEAEALLWQVVQGKHGGVGTRQYRDALVEIASLEARRGSYASAIQSLEEAVARYPEDPQIASMLYNLAAAYRQDARAISKSLQEALPDSRKEVLERTRTERLKKAQELFDRAAAALDARDPRRLSSLEKLQLRNAAFFSGDCSFELRDFEQAIRRYDAARERYPEDPASLVAMVQIVNAYVEMGDLTRAATANERAKLFHKSLPASVWADPSLPMNNDDWKKWLDSMEAIKLKPLGVAGKEQGPAGAASTAAAKDDEGEH